MYALCNMHIPRYARIKDMRKDSNKSIKKERQIYIHLVKMIGHRNIHFN